MAEDTKTRTDGEPVNEEAVSEENTAAEETAETAAEPSEEESETEKLTKQIAELNDKLLRTAAEYDNFRKRSLKEKTAIYTDTKAEVIGKLLPVIDNFERAALSDDTDPDSYRKGIEMTVKQLLDAVAGMGAEAFGEKGETFDPNFHNGVMHVEDEELGENVIADVFLKGYKLGDKVIRPATVKVAN